MATNLPLNLVQEFNEDKNEIFNAFDLPKTDTSIVKTTSIRAQLASPLTRTSKV